MARPESCESYSPAAAAVSTCLRSLSACLFALMCVAAIALASGLTAGRARADVEIIQLRYRSVEQVLPILRPLVEPGGALTGMQDQLVVRASAANIADIRKVLASIDRMPRRLMISVRQGGDAVNSARGAAVSGTVGSASGSVVISNQPRGAGDVGANHERNVTARIIDSRSASNDGVLQTIQVLEGNPAVIHVGESLPVPNRVVTRTANGLVITDNVAYRDIGTGFEVIPRLSGDRVMLDIAPRRDSPVAGGAPGSANIQRAATTLSARLGEWIELGAMNSNESNSAGGLLGSVTTQRSDNRRIQVKVEEIK